MGLINQLITGGHHPVLVDESIGVIIHELNWKSSQQSQDMMVSRVCGGTMMWGTLNKEESHAEKKSRAIAAPSYCWLFSSVNLLCFVRYQRFGAQMMSSMILYGCFF